MEYKYRIEVIIQNEDGQWADKTIFSTPSLWKFIKELIRAYKSYNYVRAIVRVK